AGAAGISLFMMGAGTLGVPRRHWDITFADANLQFELPSGAFLMMGLNGVSAILATVGGGLFVVITVASILWGKRLDRGEAPLAFPLHKHSESVAQYGSHATVKLPGTIVLVSLFFVCFVLYYFVNWKYLSELWLFR